MTTITQDQLPLIVFVVLLLVVFVAVEVRSALR